MSSEAVLTLIVVAATLGLLSLTRIGADLVLVAALTVLLASGVLTPAEALAGFGNPGLATVAALYVVVAGLVDTGAVHWISARFLGEARSVRGGQLRLMLPVSFMSAFLNNTPVVAMLVPAVQEWVRRHQLAVSKFMIPLSYAAILGGTCTLIGTSTNLIVHGLVLQHTTLGPMGFFELAWVGVPVALAGTAYVVVAGKWLLPARKPPLLGPADPRVYVMEMLVEPGGRLDGRSIEQAGLRRLPGTQLAEIRRNNTVIPAVEPGERLEGGDRLIFMGVADAMVELLRHQGLVPAPDQVFKLDTPRPERHFIEAVISPDSPVVGMSLREARFRDRYGAVAIAVTRNGQPVTEPAETFRLRAGDTLLLEARPVFLERFRNARDFLLLNRIDGVSVPRHERAGLALAILVGMVAAASTVVDMLTAALVAAALMLLTRCTTPASARAGVDWTVLVVIGASIGLGSALQVSGAARDIAQAILGLAGDHPWLVLLAVYLITSLFTEIITNNAAAVLAFPIAQAAAAQMGVSFWPFVVAIMIAASASFATPIGYQTNLMVYGPGGYRFSDYLRIGLPLNLLVAAVAVGLIPLVWRF